ncbi:Fe(2+) transporter FeoB [Candidatus Lokiarchaeum ossiferum]|uniref:Ferrous iron transport protein B n=1 Tax=Candidatus Lokiarchaeum ossiferum TaxID=2951803 RepID=A0ABY6HZF9_9ARCH|nr:Fe(2+) transporter FeoB [Candidatus Lokiarchaeum sp. B-35]
MSPQHQISDPKIIRIALAGQPNVGKSVIFNRLTGLSQVVGNWPGKTVAKAEGTAKFGNYIFKIIDLPGIYSLSTYSLEEIVSREYILDESPDYIVNVLDSNHLERNLFLTIQLLMLNRPTIISLNQIDLLKERGYEIDREKLESLLGVAVVPTVAVHNRGVHEILEEIIEIEEGHKTLSMKKITFGKEIEEKINQISAEVQELYRKISCPSKFMAMKLLENDEYCLKNIRAFNEVTGSDTAKLVYKINETRTNLENLHGEQISTILNAEMYNISSQIVTQVEFLKTQTRKSKIRHLIDHITLDNIKGYILLAVVMFGIYLAIFSFGNWISGLMDNLFGLITPGAINLLGADTWAFKIIWSSIIGGLFAGIGGVLPYVIPFFAIIEILQDTGYLPRAAYLMDRFMHSIGVHGKTIIPVLIGLGCNVPAISATSIMETEAEKKRAIVISSLIPCSAVTTIVLGLVGKYLGIGWAFLLYLINLMVIIIVGKLMSNWFEEGGIQSELIIELHDFRRPNLKVIAKQTWHRSKEFVVLALPLIVILSILMQIMMEFNIVESLNIMISPITVYILGLPIGVGIYLFYGVLRKELNLILLELYVLSIGMTMNEYMTPIQMITFTLVTMLYVPCLATIVVIGKESGKKFALQIFLFELLGAVFISAIVRWSYVLLAFILPQRSESVVMITTFAFLFGLMILTLHLIKKHSNHQKKHHRNRSPEQTILIQENLLDHSGCQSCRRCHLNQCEEKKD